MEILVIGAHNDFQKPEFVMPELVLRTMGIVPPWFIFCRTDDNL